MKDFPRQWPAANARRRRGSAKQLHPGARSRRASILHELLESRDMLTASMVISEIMYHPSSNNVAEEYVELLNTTAAPINLSGYQLAGGANYSFGNVSVPAGGYLAVAASAAAFAAKYPTVSNFVGSWIGSLDDHSATVELRDAGNNLIDSVTYANEGDWATRARGATDHNHQGWIWTAQHDGGGNSLELVNAALSNDVGTNWSSSTTAQGTPGAANSVANSNIAPLISAVTQSPIVPKSTDNVTITARISDELTSGLTVTLFERLDSAPNFTSHTMFDDGAHGDGGAGDGVFGGSILAKANGSIVEFYVSATDSTAHTRTWPAPTSPALTQSANALYQVDNTVISGTAPVYRLIMTAAERAELATIQSTAADAPSNAQMNGAFVSIDGTGSSVYYNVGIANRGHEARTATPGSFQVNFPADHLFAGVHALALNSQYTDSQDLGAAIFEASGLPAPRSRAVQLRVNNANLAAAGSPQFGSYVASEVVDDAYMRRQFPSDSSGNVYRAQRTDPPAAAQAADLSYLGASANAYKPVYSKLTNVAVDDWSDLINLTNVLANTPNATYKTAVNSVINVDNWLRYFAVNTLLDNNSPTLSAGIGNDFYLVRGNTDTRFEIVPFDLDSLAGRGASPGSTTAGLFRAAALPQLDRLLKSADFAPLYYQQLVTLINTTFSAAQINPLIDHVLGSSVPAAQVAALKTWIADRATYVLSQIPQSLTATSALPVTNGFYTTANATTSLSGLADVVGTRSVLVGGVAATWSAWQGTWSAANVALHPGINRVLVQSLDGSNQELARTTIDIWYDTGATTAKSGTLPAGITTWTAAGGPYLITANLTVPVGSTLVIQPGATVFFGGNFGITVNGTLQAEGTDLARIRFAKLPTSATLWGNITFTNSTTDNRMAYFDMENANSTSGNIRVAGSVLSVDHASWASTTRQIMNYTDSSFKLTNSVLPGVANETVHVLGIPNTGYALVQGNTFAKVSGFNDVMDITGGQRPGAIVQILDNVFNGSDDDILDLDGTDAHIEGNIFRGAHLTNPTNPDTSSAISGGQDSGNSGHYVIVRNWFYNLDHGILAKEHNTAFVVNNTFVNIDIAAVNFDEPLRSGIVPGDGAVLDGNIFWNVPLVVDNVNSDGTTTSLVMRHNIAPMALAGIGNSTADPLLVNSANITDPKKDLTLRPGSPAIGAGPNGRDIGAGVAAGASISGEPRATTFLTTATLQVGGPDIFAYKYRVNNGSWSAEIPVSNPGLANATIPPIQLSGLTNGDYAVQVVAKNSAGFWQADAAATTSKSWTVNTGLSRVLISEVLADDVAAINNGGTHPDAIELYNDSATSRNIGDMSLSNDPANPRKFVIPAGTILTAGEYRVFYADTANAAPGVHTGFTLSAAGDQVTLYNTLAAGGAALDAVAFGRQLADKSISRQRDLSWSLSTPTFGAANGALNLGDATRLKINEWLTDSPTVADFVELYNADDSPVALGGLFLNNNPSGQPKLQQVAALSFIAPQSTATYRGDGLASEHLAFGLPSVQGAIGLFDAAGQAIDIITYGPQRTDISEGRTPDGGSAFAFFGGAPDTTAPTTPTGLAGTIVSDTRIDLTWTASSDPESAITQYTIYRNGVSIGTSATNSFSDTGALASGTSIYQVSATNSVGLVSPRSASLSFTPFRDGVGPTAGYTGTRDTWLNQGTPAQINGAATTIRVDGDSSGVENMILLKWDLSNIPAGQVVTSAALTINVTDASATAPYNLYALVRDWDESQANWTEAKTGVNWGTAGARAATDRGTTVLGTVTGPSLGKLTFQLNAAGLAQVQQWINNSASNYGFAITNLASTDGLVITSRNDATAANRPRLEIGYTALNPVSVVGRNAFYNNSAFDGANSAANAADDAAIATDKSALLPGGAATFANYTSFRGGINGVMVDIANLPILPATLTASDFDIKIGNSNTPGSWAAGPAPTVTQRAGAGAGGSARVTLTWPDGAIKNTWVQVTVKANANTGLAFADVFYFGNAVGETGNSAANAQVNSADEIGARINGRTFLNPATATNVYDFNRDGLVNATDQVLARANATTLAAALQLIHPPALLSLSEASAPLSAAPSSLADASSSDATLATGVNLADRSNKPAYALEAKTLAETLVPRAASTAFTPIPPAVIADQALSSVWLDDSGAAGDDHDACLPDELLELLSMSR